MSNPSTPARPSTDLLDPTALNAQAEAAVHAFFIEGESRHTARAYRTALQYWGAWHALRFGTTLPVPVPATTVMQFIVDHLEHNPELAPPELTPFSRTSDTTQHLLPPAIDRYLVDRNYKAKLGPWSLATVKLRLAALSKAHELHRVQNPHLNWGPETNPLRDPKIRLLLAATTRAYARRGRTPKRARAATRVVMEALLATCSEDLHGIRDRALLLFGFASGGRRRSEITAATFENLQREGDGFLYELTVSKTNPYGRPDPNNIKPIQGAAAAALRRWLDVLLSQRITQGAIFRRIHGDRITDPLRADAVRNIIRLRARLAGEPLGNLSAHSLRSGFVTEAGRQNVPLSETMALTGHRSVQTAIRYYQAGDVAMSRAARLMDAEAIKKP